MYVVILNITSQEGKEEAMCVYMNFHSEDISYYN